MMASMQAMMAASYPGQTIDVGDNRPQTTAAGGMPNRTTATPSQPNAAMMDVPTTSGGERMTIQLGIPKAAVQQAVQQAGGGRGRGAPGRQARGRVRDGRGQWNNHPAPSMTQPPPT